VPAIILSLAAAISATNIKYESLITVKLGMSLEAVTGGIIHDNSFKTWEKVCRAHYFTKEM